MSDMVAEGGAVSYPESREFYLQKARRDEPRGIICGFCGKPNDFADDCGFFWLCPQGKSSIPLPACEACYDGEPGKQHIAHYGVGER
jgi:prenyltransferase beta subunit